MGGKKRSGREVAFAVLEKFDAGRSDASQLLYSMIGRTEQRGQATDIVFGVIRNRDVIDRIITSVSKVPIERVKGKCLNILRIGTYELVFAPDTAEYAIVNDAVNIAHRFGGKKQAGFVNAVLRNILRGIDGRKVSLDEGQSKRTVPQSVEWGCLFAKDIVSGDGAEYLSEAFSLPAWLVDRWVDEFGYDGARGICFASNRKPSIYLRANSLLATATGLLDKFADAGVEAVEVAGALKLVSRVPITELPGFAEGLFTVQDSTAGKVAPLFDLQPGQVVVDLCSAPGGKTTHIAELMADEGTVIATDIDSERLKKVDENRERLGIKSIRTVGMDELDEAISQAGRVDAVLVDVPCSNTGVLAKRVEVRHRLTQEGIAKLAEVQLDILQRAAKLVGTHGRICYSTCSISQEENRGVVDQFLAEDKRFVLTHEELTLPQAGQFDHDGGYAAIMVRN
ncbi:MAG: hypothetical protein KAS23_08820 [Anaerohalosphaera sp.]|nr:hypothetical protein [Anaerohalosphaera sp.]